MFDILEEEEEEEGKEKQDMVEEDEKQTQEDEKKKKHESETKTEVEEVKVVVKSMSDKNEIVLPSPVQSLMLAEIEQNIISEIKIGPQIPSHLRSQMIQEEKKESEEKRFGGNSPLQKIALIMRKVVILNRADLSSFLLQEEIFFRVAGCLEYDPSLMVKGNYRDFLKNKANLKILLPFPPQIEAAIKENFRVNFLIDSLIRPCLDEPPLSSYRAIMGENIDKICTHVMGEKESVGIIVQNISSPHQVRSPPTNNKRKQSILFLRELFLLTKKLPPQSRFGLYASFFGIPPSSPKNDGLNASLELFGRSESSSGSNPPSSSLSIPLFSSSSSNSNSSSLGFNTSSFMHLLGGNVDQFDSFYRRMIPLSSNHCEKWMDRLKEKERNIYKNEKEDEEGEEVTTTPSSPSSKNDYTSLPPNLENMLVSCGEILRNSRDEEEVLAICEIIMTISITSPQYLRLQTFYSIPPATPLPFTSPTNNSLNKSDGDDDDDSLNLPTTSTSILYSLIYVLTNSLHPPSRAVVEYVREIIVLMIDPMKMDQASERDSFLLLFYDYYIQHFLLPILPPVSDSSASYPYSIDVYQTILDIIAFCISIHSYRMKYLMMRNTFFPRDIFGHILSHPSRILPSSVFGLFHALALMDDQFYSRHLVKTSCLSPIFRWLEDYKPVSTHCSSLSPSLTMSSLLSIFDMIRVENQKILLEEIVKEYKKRESLHVEGALKFEMDKLQLKMDQNMSAEEEKEREMREEDEKASFQGELESTKRKRDFEEMQANEAYFDRDEDEDGGKGNTNLLTNGKFSKGPLSLLQIYGEEGDEEKSGENGSSSLTIDQTLLLPSVKKDEADIEEEEDEIYAFFSNKKSKSNKKQRKDSITSNSSLESTSSTTDGLFNLSFKSLDTLSSLAPSSSPKNKYFDTPGPLPNCNNTQNSSYNLSSSKKDNEESSNRELLNQALKNVDFSNLK